VFKIIGGYRNISPKGIESGYYSVEEVFDGCDSSACGKCITFVFRFVSVGAEAYTMGRAFEVA